VIEAAANQKFGHDVFQETSEDALRSWEHRAGKPAERSVVKDLFPYAHAKAHEIACFRSISPGASMYDIVKHCGEPDEENRQQYLRFHILFGGWLYCNRQYALSETSESNYLYQPFGNACTYSC